MSCFVLYGSSSLKCDRYLLGHNASSFLAKWQALNVVLMVSLPLLTCGASHLTSLFFMFPVDQKARVPVLNFSPHVP